MTLQQKMMIAQQIRQRDLEQTQIRVDTGTY